MPSFISVVSCQGLLFLSLNTAGKQRLSATQSACVLSGEADPAVTLRGAYFYRIIDRFIDQTGVNGRVALGGTFRDDMGGLSLKHDRKVGALMGLGGLCPLACALVDTTARIPGRALA